MDSTDHATTAPGSIEPASSRGTLWLLIGVMIGLTVLEWGLFLARGSLGSCRPALVPVLLVSSLAKMALVVLGITRLGNDPGLSVKVAFAAFIVGGGMTLAFVELLA